MGGQDRLGTSEPARAASSPFFPEGTGVTPAEVSVGDELPLGGSVTVVAEGPVDCGTSRGFPEGKDGSLLRMP